MSGHEPAAAGSRVVRPGDVPPEDYARITLQVGVAQYGGRWGYDSRADALREGRDR